MTSIRGRVLGFAAPLGLAGRPPLPSFVRRLRLGRAAVLVARPNPRAYGHQALEILHTIELARREGAAVAFVEDPAASNPALYRVEAEGVRVLHGATRLLDIALATPLVRLDAARAALRAAIDEELGRRKHSTRLPSRVHRDLRQHRRRRRERRDEAPETYMRRRLVREAPRMRLEPRLQARVDRSLRELGIPAGARIACIHARETGFKRGREVEHKGGRRADSVRNASIASYGAAVDLLLEHGYVVVRIGDPTMAPLGHPDVIDLVATPRRTPELEVVCLLESSLLLCGESGPFLVSLLSDTSMVCVNGTDLVSAYPVRASGFLLMKHVVDRTTGEELSTKDFLSERYVTHLRDPSEFVYAANTPEEIRAAVAEALAWREGGGETERQRRFREYATETATSLRAVSRYVRKWGPDGGFLGDGRVVDFRLAEEDG